MSEPAPRVFAAHRDGTTDVLSEHGYVALTGVSPAASAAVDIMMDDGVPAEEAWKMALAAAGSGKDPEAFARHFVKMRKFARTL